MSERESVTLPELERSKRSARLSQAELLYIKLSEIKRLSDCRRDCDLADLELFRLGTLPLAQKRRELQAKTVSPQQSR